MRTYPPSLAVGHPALTGVPFNDAYRYMDWLLTLPLPLIEILLVMKLDAEAYSAKAKVLGSNTMSASSVPGLMPTPTLRTRWALMAPWK